MRQPALSTPSELSTRVVLLLAVAMFINHVDRGSLATASPLIRDTFSLSNSQIGLLLSAFFWTYAPLQPVAGWVADRYDVRYVLAGGLAVWSIATMLTGLATTFVALIGLRILLGIGESVIYPCNSTLLAQRAPEHERGRANGLIAGGQSLGVSCGTLVGGLLMVRYGWRATFVVFGLVSLIWLLPWAIVTRGGAATVTNGGAAATAGSAAHLPPVTYLAILTQRALWGSSLGSFCYIYAYYFVLTWLPLFLVKAHGFSVNEMAQVGAGIYGVHAISAVTIGRLSDRWIIKGVSANRVRKGLLLAGLVGIAVLLMACANAGSTLSVLLLAIIAALFGTQTPNIYALSQTLGGPRAAGQWMGVMNLIGNLAGVIAPPLTGFVIDRTGGYFWAFGITAGVALLGTLAFGILLPKIEPVVWPESFGKAA